MQHLQCLDEEHVCGYYCQPPLHADVVHLRSAGYSAAELLAIMNAVVVSYGQQVLTLRPAPEVLPLALAETCTGYARTADGSGYTFELQPEGWMPWLATYTLVERSD